MSPRRAHDGSNAFSCGPWDSRTRTKSESARASARDSTRDVRERRRGYVRFVLVATLAVSRCRSLRSLVTIYSMSQTSKSEIRSNSRFGRRRSPSRAASSRHRHTPTRNLPAPEGRKTRTSPISLSLSLFLSFSEREKRDEDVGWKKKDDVDNARETSSRRPEREREREIFLKHARSVARSPRALDVHLPVRGVLLDRSRGVPESHRARLGRLGASPPRDKASLERAQSDAAHARDPARATGAQNDHDHDHDHDHRRPREGAGLRWSPFFSPKRLAYTVSSE